MAFKETEPAGRRGCIEFFPELMKDPPALAAAKAFTLCSTNQLPEVKVHANQTDDISTLQLVSCTQFVQSIDLFWSSSSHTIHVITF